MQEQFLEITQQLIQLDGAIAELRAAVSVVKLYVVHQMTPDDPVEGLKQLQGLEKMMLQHDPNAPARQEAAEVIEAVKLWKKHSGGHRHES